MTALTQAINEALLHSIWQGVLIAALLWMMLFLLRARSANARYLASCVALFGLFALSLITVWAVYERPGPLGLEIRAAFWIPADPAVSWIATAKAWSFPLWVTGVALFSLRLLWGYGQISVWRSKGTPGDAAMVGLVAGLAERMGIRRRVDVLISSLADAPGMIGWLRPVLLVPAATISGLTPQQLESILAHELAHIRRHDYLVNIGQMVVETLLFYHPAIWWASSQIRRERELACDDLAVESVGDALSYARALTALEKTRVLAPSMAMGSTRGRLMYRVQRLVAPDGRAYRPSKLAGVTVLFLLSVTCLFLGMSWASTQAQATKTVQAPRPVARQAAPRTTPASQASDFLRQELERAKAALEKAEDNLQNYSRSNGLLILNDGVDERRNVEVARLTALQNALTATQIEGFQKDAVVQVTKAEIANSAASNAALVDLRREDARLAVTHSREFTPRLEIRAQIEAIEKELRGETVASVQRAEVEHRIVLVKERMIRQELEDQRLRLNLLAQESAEYQILRREVETNRQRYDSLLERFQDAQLARE
jgi:beta-lactamase regulating signal transducer with metallopeptidase domain